MEERGEEFYACFLDEKWFYTTSHRRKIKILPPGPGEDPAAVAHVPLTAVSRRHAIKVGTPPSPIDCCVIVFVSLTPIDCCVVSHTPIDCCVRLCTLALLPSPSNHVISMGRF